MKSRGISDLFQNYYNDHDFRELLISATDETIKSYDYQLSSQEREMVKAFIQKNWNASSKEYSVRKNGKGFSSQHGSSCGSCACGCACCDRSEIES